MKFKFLLTLTLAGAAALSAWAQGYKDGVEYYKADRFADAEELLTRNLNNADTNKAEAYFYLGQIQLARYYSAKRTGSADANTYKNDALSFFNKGLAADADNPFNYVGLGNIELINSDSKAAEDYFKKAEKLGGKDAGVYAAVARAYYDVNPTIYAKQMDKAIEKGNKLVQKQALSNKPQWAPNDQDFYMFIGDMKFDAANGDSQKVGDACNDYEQAIRVNPKAAEGYIKYADKLFTVNRFDEAIAQLNTLLQNNPNSALGQRELAERLYERGKVQDAIAQYGKLVKNPNHFAQDEVRYLAMLYFVEDFNKGYDEATAILAKDPDNFTARRLQYLFASRAGRPDALTLGEQLLKLKNDKNVFAYGDYSAIAGDMLKAGRTQDALTVLETGINDYSDNPAMYKEAARLYLSKEISNYPKAADSMAKAIELLGAEASASDYNALSDYAYYAASTEGIDDATKTKYLNMSENAINKAAEHLADNYKYLVPKRLGDIYRAKGDNSKAAENYFQSLALVDANGGLTANNTYDVSSMYRFIGGNYIQENDKAKAREYLQKYLDLNPNDTAIADIIKKL
ncbi:MAG: tetratricopeptide repeat protein [Muribaculaceae bacterium]|nr:tetratricopeptide repeat protein [Muribaculaceae bacterium]